MKRVALLALVLAPALHAQEAGHPWQGRGAVPSYATQPASVSSAISVLSAKPIPQNTAAM